MVTLTLRPLVVEFIREEQFEMKSAYCPKCHRVGGKVGSFCVPCGVALEPHEKPEEQHEEATAADRIGYLMGFDGPPDHDLVQQAGLRPFVGRWMPTVARGLKGKT